MEEAKSRVKELKEQLEKGSYQVDAKAVAEALLRSPLLLTLLRPS
jgi:anti-sigma28 factor (negative regulator of flagellin synthesis)